MAPGIKTCSSCGGLYTGTTATCWSCILRSHPMPPPAVRQSRAERRAAERLQREQAVANARVATGLAQTTAPARRKRSKSPSASPNVTTATHGAPSPQPAPLPSPKLRKPARTKSTPQRQPTIEQKRGTVPMPSPEPGLGALAQAEGHIRAEVGPGGRVVTRATVQCSCLGLNQNCFKCDGTGYCEVEVVSTVPSLPGGGAGQLKASSIAAKSETHFSNDSRGGDTYGIRERGRFGSNPLHDDHDE